ncbi:hypothetical protein BDN71DRAFT_1434144 [Pleurotus eryngii]|uniref:Uncharacterized protein n=1 Tax=Pleurotus eryngii TaxID=5323 RepID=A0A9P5ZPD4_PLEER|nr:hypothetical protein BDN71DRAFT_1434144 [Pleurotus eryngii]
MGTQVAHEVSSTLLLPLLLRAARVPIQSSRVGNPTVQGGFQQHDPHILSMPLPLVSPRLPPSAHELIRWHTVHQAAKLEAQMQHINQHRASLIQRRQRSLTDSKVEQLEEELRSINTYYHRLLKRKSRLLLDVSRMT